VHRQVRRSHKWFAGRLLAVALSVPAVLIVAPGTAAAAQANVYKVAKYPVQAQAEDAVTAKAQALADAQQGAFRSLMKRLVPVTAYKRLPKMPLARVQDMIAGFSVRSERNSSTEYLASYDFEFQPRAVREMLRSSGLLYVEDIAPPTVLVAAYGASPQVGSEVAPAGAKSAKAPSVASASSLPAHLTAARAAPQWTKAWADLDTDNALAPLRLAKTGEQASEDSIRRALGGDWTALRALAGNDTNSERTVLAYAEPSADGRKLQVTLIGRDALGWLSVTRTYPILDADVGYATELAAVVGLGILEGRWKALKSRSATTGTISADGVDGWNTTTDKDERGVGSSTSGVSVSQPSPGAWTSDDIEFVVEFRGLSQWQQIRRRLNETPGVEDMEISQMSARTANVKLRYPGGPERLAGDLSAQGMQLSNQGDQWILQAR
jgi:hypothetical protein